MKERTNTSRLFELFAKFVQGLTDQEITELLAGKIKIELKGRKSKVKNIELHSLEEAKGIINKIMECRDRGAAWGQLNTLDRVGLQAIAEVSKIPNQSKLSRDRLIESILGTVYDYDQTWKAIESAGKREKI